MQDNQTSPNPPPAAEPDTTPEEITADTAPEETASEETSAVTAPEKASADTAAEEASAEVSPEATAAEETSADTAEPPAKKKTLTQRVQALEDKIDGTAATLTAKTTLSPALLLESFICGFLAASILPLLRCAEYANVSFLNSVNIPVFLVTIVITMGLLCLSTVRKKTARKTHRALLGFSLSFAILLSGTQYKELYICIGIAFVMLIILRYLLSDNRLELGKKTMSERKSFLITCAVCASFTAFITLFTYFRHAVYDSATYDFGIFTQMFEYMRTVGLPLSTVERDGLVSHFSVHFSPFYYLLLPGYLVWSSPVYLLFTQALALGLCVFPVRRICMSLGFSPKLTVACVFFWTLYPSFGYGCFNDFHENKFLPICLLWMLAMVLEKRNVATFFFALLTLSIKEDAAIYVAAVGLYMIFARRERIFGALLTILAVGYFFFAVGMIDYFGGEAMINRFARYYPEGDESLFGVIKTCFFDIGYLIQSVFTVERFEYLLWLFFPLLFAPFLTKNIWSLLLMLPLLVINLMPALASQYDFYYQYTYGSATLLFFSAIVVIASMKPEMRRFFVTASMVISIIFSSSVLGNKCIYYVVQYTEVIDECNEATALLRTIPPDASVTARDFVVPHISYTEHLHTVPVFYGGLCYTDYYVLDTRESSVKYAGIMEDFVKDDYILIGEAGFLQLWQLTDTSKRVD